MTPEDKRRHTEEWKQRLREEEKKRRAKFEAVIARKDVRELAPLWHTAMGDACNAYNGPTRLDLEELESATFELAIAAEVARKPHQNVDSLRAVLREMISGTLIHDRSSFGHGQPLTQLRANAAIEIDRLVLAHEAALRRGDEGHKAEPPTASGTQVTSPRITAEKASALDPIAQWYELRPAWGRPRSKDGGRPVEINWRSNQSIETAVMLIKVIESLLPHARAANPDYVLQLHDLAHRLHNADFLVSPGTRLESFIALLAQVDLIVADLRSLQIERQRDASASDDRIGNQALPDHLGPVETANAGKAAPLPAPGAQPAPMPTPDAEGEALQFNAAERAIVLLLRDGRHPRSMREYAKEVGVSHTTLSRNESWQRAWKVMQEAGEKDKAEMPDGSKNAEGNLEAWLEDEVCENCRQEPIVASVTVDGEVVRMCEDCQRKQAQRTKPRTS